VVAERRHLTPIDVATNTRGVPIALDFLPDQVAIAPDGNSAYVTASDRVSLVPVDLNARRHWCVRLAPRAD